MASARTRRLVKLAVAGVDELDRRIRRRPHGVTVLAYHDVGGEVAGEVDIAPEVFEEHVAYLTDRGLVTSLDEALAALATGRPLDRPRVVLTFDDGTAGFAEDAVPILEKYRAPVTLYLSTYWVEEETPFWNGAKALTWQALREALGTGLVGIGSHSHRHLLFDRTDPAVLAADLDRSIGLIQDNLDVDPVDFAYPKALAPSSEAAHLVARRFRSAALAGGRANTPGVDPHRLERTPVQRSDAPAFFRRKAAGGMTAEAVVRRSIARLRYRGAQA